jgi:hypothetical protein
VSRNIIENRERGQGTVGREKEGREHTNSAVEGTLVSHRRHWLLLAGNEGREKWAGKWWEGNIHNREHIQNVHSTGLKSMHETLIWCMHENVNDYADDLIKLFFKQTVSKDLSISKSAHTHFWFKHMAWTLKATSLLQLWLVSAVRGLGFRGGGGTQHEATFLPVPALGDNPTPSPPLPIF